MSKVRSALAVAVLIAVATACGGGSGSDGGSSGPSDQGTTAAPTVTAGTSSASAQGSTPTSVPAGTAFAAGTVVDGRWLISSTHVEALKAGKGTAVAPSKAAGHGLSGKLREASYSVGLGVRVKDAKNFWFLSPLPQYGGWRVGEVLGGKIVKSFAIKLVTSKAGTAASLISDGDTLKAVIAGNLRLTVTASDLADQTGVGVASLAPGTGGWTDLSVQP